jgi:hypothetical protein
VKLIRTIYLGLALSIGTIFAHHVAGGAFVNLPQFLLVAVATYGVGALLSRSEMEGPGLAAAIVVTQMFGHVALSSKYENSLVMYGSHLFLGLLSYLLLGSVEKMARWAFDHLVVGFEKLPEIHMDKRAVLFLEDLRSVFVNRAITRFWSPAPPLPSL